MVSKTFNSYDLDQLTKIAKEDSRHRKHLNLHNDFNDPVQYFVNRILRNSYIRPHYHDLSSGIEILVALSGVSVVVIFDDNGNIKNFVFLECLDKFSKKGTSAVISLAPLTWHTLIPLDENVTLLEIKKGPFNPLAAKHPAEWAPKEDSKRVQPYFDDLVDKAMAVYLSL
jgi:cupin fold WbuC family metalloprotein